MIFSACEIDKFASQSAIYIHYPFPRTDGEPEQDSRRRNRQTSKYTSALSNDVAELSDRFPYSGIDAIYIGGGRPSLWFPEQIEELLTQLRSHFELHRELEFSLEALPADITSQKLKVWQQLGVNRLCIRKVLLSDDSEWRRYRQKLSRVADSNIDEWSIEYQLGVSGEAPERFFDRLSFLLKEYSPDHVTIVETDSSARDVSADSGADLERISDTVGDLGYRRYRADSWAKPDCESRYTLTMDAGGAYLGLGVSATSLFEEEQRICLLEGIDDLSSFMKSASSRRYQSQYLTGQHLISEWLIRSMFSYVGLSVEELDRLLTGEDANRVSLERLERGLQQLCEKDLLDFRGGRYIPNQRGMDRNDGVCRFLLSKIGYF